MIVRQRSPEAAPSTDTVGLMLANAPRTFDAIARARAERSLIAFVELFWPIIEPKQPFVRGWVQEEIARHLEAVTEERISKLLINVPPGFSKSTLVNVFWAAWEWGPRRRPDLRYISWSYSAGLTERDNSLCRKIIESPLYQRLWGQCEPCRKRAEGAPRCKVCETERRFRLDGDQNAKTRYRNDWGGFRFASSVGGAGTGERADRLIFDDPHSVQTAESDTERQATVDWFAGTLPTRVRNSDGSSSVIKLPEWVRRAHRLEDDDGDERALKSATVGIMQRVHLKDVSGVILATPELGYEHLLIEMEYEGDRHPARLVANDNARPLSPGTSIGCRDPRRAMLAAVLADVAPSTDDAVDVWWAAFANVWVRIGVDLATLAWPSRFPRHAIEPQKHQMRLKAGANAVTAQFQQWPQEAGGLYFPEECARYLELDELLPPLCGYETRGWDLAATDDDPMSAATVGVRGYIDINNRVIVTDVVKIRGGPDEVDALLSVTADLDGGSVHQDVPQDPGQAGKYQVNAIVRNLVGHVIDHSPEAKKSKAARALPLSSQWKIGNVYMVRAVWNAEYLRIMRVFPVDRDKDEVDASVRMLDSQVRAEPMAAPVAPRTIKLAHRTS